MRVCPTKLSSFLPALFAHTRVCVALTYKFDKASGIPVTLPMVQAVVKEEEEEKMHI